MSRRIQLDEGRKCLVRITAPDLSALSRLLRKRYPNKEWGTLMLCGTRRTRWGLAASVVSLLAPESGEMDRSSPLFVARSAYLGRAKTAGDRYGHSVTVVHSHPQGCATFPSPLDDEMDLYCASFYGARPYLSLIFSWDETGELRFSGRAYDRGRWMPVVELFCPGEQLKWWHSQIIPEPVVTILDGELRNQRLVDLMGTDSGRQIARARLAFIGCSGTGSPGVDRAARAGFQYLVTVDPEREAPSNLERMSGSKAEDFKDGQPPPYKVESMRRMVHEIDPSIEVVPIVGNILDDHVLDYLLTCDAVINYTDTHHSRAFLSHLATHYLVPCLDVGVSMEGENGQVTMQHIEFTKFWPGSPCAFCRRKIVQKDLNWELMSEAERAEREALAKQVAAAGGNPDMYWGGRPRQIHTVGYLTMAAGSLAVGYIIGAITGTFKMPHDRFQFDPSAPFFGFVPFSDEVRIAGCQCGGHLGWADSAIRVRSVARPNHWPQPQVI